MNNFLDTLVGDTFVCTCCIILLWVIFLINRKSLFTSKIPNNFGTGYFILWMVITIYAAFYCPPKGDNATSMMRFYYPYINGVDEKNLHFEYLYFRIMDLVPYGYVLWRIAVWGILGATSYIVLCKLLKCDKNLATIACITFALPVLFYYQRATAGYCLMYIAMFYLVEKNYNLVFRVGIASVIMIVALQFHTSMVFYLSILLISYFVQVSKKSLAIIIIMSLIFSFSVLEYSNLFLKIAPEETTETGIYYLDEAERSSQNVFGQLFSLFEKIPAYFIVISCYWVKLKNNSHNNKYEDILLTNTLLLILLSIIFSQISSVLEAKFYKASMMPLTLFLVLYFQRKRGSTLCNTIVYITMLCLVIANGYRIFTNSFYFV